MGFMDYQRHVAERGDGMMSVVAIALTFNTFLLALILWRVW